MAVRYAFLFVTLLIVVSSIFLTDTLSSVEANTGEELEGKIDSYIKQQDENERKSEMTEEELAILEEEMIELQTDIRRTDEEITLTNDDISGKQDEIENRQDHVEVLKDNIIELQDRIEERDKLLKKRVRSMYQNGGTINYIEVILGAQSFGDLIERVTALNTVAEQDQAILDRHIEDMDELERAKTQLENELIKLEDQMSELEQLRENLEKSRAQKDRIMATLEKKEIYLKEQMMSLDEEQELLKVQEKAAKDELERWKEQEEKRRKEEERRRREAEAAKQAGVPPSDSSGILMRPASGTVTSNYGPRWGRIHHGMDIGQGGRSNVPIVAAEEGTVIEARYMNGYGNTIMISHVVDGRTLTTLYAHLASMRVSKGDRVSRGQQIAVMGNTGVSTGPHLHFEVHEGGWNSAKSNSVNPANYLN